MVFDSRFSFLVFSCVVLGLFLFGCLGLGGSTGSPLVVSSFDLEGKPFVGGENAKVTLVEFSDFQCPYCARSAATLQQIEKEYGTKVKVYFKHFPLDKNYNPLLPYQIHPSSGRAAVASEAAGAQGKFFEYHDLLFANQGVFDDASLSSYAGQLGLDVEKFQRDLNGQEAFARVLKDIEEGNKIGISATPTVFVNGKQTPASYEQLKQAIDEELKK
ncbi:thioredoxin domain-containing protein [Candidatus Micrarchaeota archaeon]|nr:thioredoxin domain-containing protein [Candidatus Micrarchaeota archaeon]